MYGIYTTNKIVEKIDLLGRMEKYLYLYLYEVITFSHINYFLLFIIIE